MFSGTLDVCTEEASSRRNHRIHSSSDITLNEMKVCSGVSRQRAISHDPKAKKVYYQKPKSFKR